VDKIIREPVPLPEINASKSPEVMIAENRAAAAANAKRLLLAREAYESLSRSYAR
jgi:hypothetical protein